MYSIYFINLVLLKMADPSLIIVGMLFKMIELLFLDNRVHPSTLWIKQLIFQITTHIIITLCVAVSFAFFAHCAPQQELMLWHGQRTHSTLYKLHFLWFVRQSSLVVSSHHIISFQLKFTETEKLTLRFFANFLTQLPTNQFSGDSRLGLPAK